ncbi:unnamed protein product [Caenorhabditis nigoni]
MPICILSLSDKDLQYALNCMDICDLVAFSLCSNRTKNLVKRLNRNGENIFAEINESGIRLDIRLWTYPGYQSLVLLMDFSNRLVKLEKENKYWRKKGFTHRNWIAHFMSIFYKTDIDRLGISNVCSIPYLDNVKKIIHKCKTLRINENCSTELTKTAFFKLAPIAKEVEINNNPFDIENDISKFLSLNLRALRIHDWEHTFEVKLADLLTANVIILNIRTANISGKEVNRFLKLWMKSNHRFYRPKLIRLWLSDGIEINHEEILRGIEHDARSNNCVFLLKRSDGKRLMVSIKNRLIEFIIV